MRPPLLASRGDNRFSRGFIQGVLLTVCIVILSQYAYVSLGMSGGAPAGQQTHKHIHGGPGWHHQHGRSAFNDDTPHWSERHGRGHGRHHQGARRALYSTLPDGRPCVALGCGASVRPTCGRFLPFPKARALPNLMETLDLPGVVPIFPDGLYGCDDKQTWCRPRRFGASYSGFGASPGRVLISDAA